MRAAVPFLFVFFLIAAGCNSSSGSGDGCVALAGDGQLAGVRTAAQVMIEAKLVLIDQDSFLDLGLDFPIIQAVLNDNGGALGGLSGQGRDVVADAETVGGPGTVPYLVPNAFDGFLSIVNLNFSSPFAGQPVKIFVTLPFAGECVTLDSNVTTQIQGFAGGAKQTLLAPVDPGLVGTVCFDFPDPTALANLLSQLAGDTRNKILDVPTVITYDGQRVLINLQDVNPAPSDLTPPFQSAVQAVTPAPLGIFSGVTIDIKPVISGNSVLIEVRLGTQMLSFFRSVPADVGGQQADVEIPVIAPSVVKTTLAIQDGQTIVIGDFQRQGQSATERGIPLLKEIPVLGSLFKNESNDNQNLMIFLTPTIIPGSEE